jgi:hypothetical protein
MKKYNLIFIFGRKEENNDQILLVSKADGLKAKKWNGLGGEIKPGKSTIFEHIADLNIPVTQMTIKLGIVLAYPRAQVYVYGVHLNMDLVEVAKRLQDVINTYWVTSPAVVIRKANKRISGYMPDLSYLIPLMLDPTIGEVVITKEYPPHIPIAEIIQKF